jgi:hypothetical protein
MILTGLVVTAAFLRAYSIFTSREYMAAISNPAFPQKKSRTSRPRPVQIELKML